MTSSIIPGKFESSIADTPNYKNPVLNISKSLKKALSKDTIISCKYLVVELVKAIPRQILSSDEKHLLRLYIDASPLEGGRLKDCFLSNDRASYETSMSLKTIDRCRRKLKRFGIIREVAKHERHERIKNNKLRSQVEILIAKLRVLATYSVTPHSGECNIFITRQPDLHCVSKARQTDVHNNKTLLNNKNVGVSASQEEKREEKKDEKVVSQRSKIRQKIERAKKRGEIHQRYKDLEELEREVNAHVNENKSKGFTEAQSIKGAITMIRDGAFNTPTGYRKERERENSQLESPSNRKTGTWIDAGMSVRHESAEENERKYQEQLRRLRK